MTVLSSGNAATSASGTSKRETTCWSSNVGTGCTRSVLKCGFARTTRARFARLQSACTPLARLKSSSNPQQSCRRRQPWANCPNLWTTKGPKQQRYKRSKLETLRYYLQRMHLKYRSDHLVCCEGREKTADDREDYNWTSMGVTS